jgi:hypothetical protein
MPGFLVVEKGMKKDSTSNTHSTNPSMCRMVASAPLLLSRLIRIISRALLTHLPLIPNLKSPYPPTTWLTNPKQHENINTRLILSFYQNKLLFGPTFNYYSISLKNLISWHEFDINPY